MPTRSPAVENVIAGWLGRSIPFPRNQKPRRRATPKRSQARIEERKLELEREKVAA